MLESFSQVLSKIECRWNWIEILIEDKKLYKTYEMVFFGLKKSSAGNSLAALLVSNNSWGELKYYVQGYSYITVPLNMRALIILNFKLGLTHSHVN